MSKKFSNEPFTFLEYAEYCLQKNGENPTKKAIDDCAQSKRKKFCKIIKSFEKEGVRDTWFKYSDNKDGNVASKSHFRFVRTNPQFPGMDGMEMLDEVFEMWETSETEAYEMVDMIYWLWWLSGQDGKFDFSKCSKTADGSIAESDRKNYYKDLVNKRWNRGITNLSKKIKEELVGIREKRADKMSDEAFAVWQYGVCKDFDEIIQKWRFIYNIMLVMELCEEEDYKEARKISSSVKDFDRLLEIPEGTWQHVKQKRSERDKHFNLESSYSLESQYRKMEKSYNQLLERFQGIRSEDTAESD